jgi:hypothetical protein
VRQNLRIINVLALAITIGINYLSNTRFFNGATVGSIAAHIPTLITPAPYAFSIWALIYLALAAFVLYHLRLAPDARNDVSQVGGWFLLSCLFNCCWVLAWIYGHIGWSVIMIVLLLGCLLRIMYRTKMELTDPPAVTVVFLWWPFCLYIGWIVLATFVNMTVWITSLQLTTPRVPAALWAAVLLGGVGLVYLLLTWLRNMRETGLVGVWGLAAVGVEDRSHAPFVAWVAWSLATVLLLSTAIHAYRNRRYTPFRRREA